LVQFWYPKGSELASGWTRITYCSKLKYRVIVTFTKIFVVLVLALALIGWLADRRAAASKPDVTPGLSFLPGDIKYESPSGNVRIYFPIVTSIVLSVLLTLILRFLS
jgi:energy-coupling factor transporter transmembrane protein EcfT